MNCGDQTDACAYYEDVCNGIANCPAGEDEDLEMCDQLGVFSDLATLKCLKKDTYVDIMIKAVLCDGMIECKHEEDEQNCFLPYYIFIVTLVIAILVCYILAYLVWKHTRINLEPNRVNQPEMIPDFESLHQTMALKNVMFQAQNLDNSEDINSEFVAVEMKLHNKDQSELVCCMKNYLDPETVATIMRHFLEKQE